MSKPTGEGAAVNWREKTMTELCDHIEQTHHEYLRARLPRLQAMVDTIARVHGPSHESLYEVQQVFAGLREQLQQRTEKEDDTVFPFIRTLEADASGATTEHAAGIIAELESEFHETTADLAKLRELTDDYTPPADACGTYVATLAGLAELEKETQEHIHKENSILFPRALTKVRQSQQ